MSLFSTLRIATSGLAATQAGIALVGQNVANAQSAGYTKRLHSPTQQVVAGRTTGVDAGVANRILSTTVRERLVVERTGSAYADTRADYALSLDRLFGRPGAAGSLDFAVNGFSRALEALAENPQDMSARAGVVAAGQGLATRLNALSAGVQDLRTSAERGLAVGAREATTILERLADINMKLGGAGAFVPNPALEDERDRLIMDLSRLVDVVRTDRIDGTTVLRTSSGMTLLDGTLAHRLVFEPRAALGPDNLVDDPAASPGRLLLVSPGGGAIDATRGGVIRSGELFAHLEARDTILVQAQTQLDELAAGLARVMSDTPAGITGTGPGPYTVTNPRTITSAEATNASGYTLTLSIDVAGETRFVSGTAATLPAALQATLGGTPSVTTDPLTGQLVIDGLDSATVVGATWTAGTATNGPSLSFFGTRGSDDPILPGADIVGLAGRIAVSRAVVANPAIVAQGGGTPPLLPGDTRRVQALAQNLAGTARPFAAQAMIGGAFVPFTATIPEFARRIVETQGAAAESAAQIADGQKIALAVMEARFAEDAAVNIDEEMAWLVKLQTAYSANARVMTAARDMLDMLMRI